LARLIVIRIYYIYVNFQTALHVAAGLPSGNIECAQMLLFVKNKFYFFIYKYI